MTKNIHDIIKIGSMINVFQVVEENKKICLKTDQSPKVVTTQVTKNSANPNKVELITFDCVTKDKKKQNSANSELILSMSRDDINSFYATYSGFPSRASEGAQNMKKPTKFDAFKTFMNKGWESAKKILSDDDSKSTATQTIALFSQESKTVCFFASSAVIPAPNSDKYLSTATMVCITPSKNSGFLRDYAPSIYVSEKICEATERNKDLFSAMLVNVEELCALKEITGNSIHNPDSSEEL